MYEQYFVQVRTSAYNKPGGVQGGDNREVKKIFIIVQPLPANVMKCQVNVHSCQVNVISCQVDDTSLHQQNLLDKFSLEAGFLTILRP